MAKKTTTKSAAPKAKAAKTKNTNSKMETIDAAKRRELIAQRAYFRAQERNFEANHDQEDWYMAEKEVDSTYLVK
jgi:hypothetical protein